jgi:hypothetical protein
MQRRLNSRARRRLRTVSVGVFHKSSLPDRSSVTRFGYTARPAHVPCVRKLVAVLTGIVAVAIAVLVVVGMVEGADRTSRKAARVLRRIGLVLFAGWWFAYVAERAS